MIYLVVALLGLLLLFFYSVNSTEVEVKISELNNSFLDSTVIVKARIDSYYMRKNLFLFLNDGSAKIKAIKFNPSINDLIIVENNKFIEVKARVNKNKNSIELIVEEMKAWH